MPTLTLIELLKYAQRQIKPLPKDKWKGKAGNGASLQITDHRTGVDLSRGPWVKFKFTYDNGDETEYEVQGYETWRNGDRIKYGKAGKMKECDDDRLSFTLSGDVLSGRVSAIVKFQFEQETDLFALRFEGESNDGWLNG